MIINSKCIKNCDDLKTVFFITKLFGLNCAVFQYKNGQNWTDSEYDTHQDYSTCLETEIKLERIFNNVLGSEKFYVLGSEKF